MIRARLTPASLSVSGMMREELFQSLVALILRAMSRMTRPRKVFSVFNASLRPA